MKKAIALKVSSFVQSYTFNQIGLVILSVCIYKLIKSTLALFNDPVNISFILALINLNLIFIDITAP